MKVVLPAKAGIQSTRPRPSPGRRYRLSLLFIIPWLLSGCATGTFADGSAEPMWTAVAPNEQLVRVRIYRARSSARISAEGGVEFRAVGETKNYQTSKPIKVAAGSRWLSVGGRHFSKEVWIRPLNPESKLALNGRRYRGLLRIRRGSGWLEIINEIGMEHYLCGVLPKEVGSSWPKEGLKVQAVISRTYALSNLAKDPKSAYDLVNSVSDQVYGGYSAELPEANQAVEETRGLVLLDNDGKPLSTFFHAACGGQTDLPDVVWPSRVSNSSYGSVKDTFCSEYPRMKWTTELTWSKTLQRLRKAGINLRDLRKIEIVKKTESGRTEIIGLRTSRGLVEVHGNRFRLALGPEVIRSMFLTDIDNERKTVRFKGLGWGHGVGLCQWGARGRALAGHTYEQILKAYYPNAKLVKRDSLLQ